MQLESIHHLKASSPVKSHGGLVACRDNHVGGVLSPPSDLGEELLNQECTGPASPGSRSTAIARSSAPSPAPPVP